MAHDIDPDDVAEFLRKVELVERQVKGLAEGTLNPDEVKAPDRVSSWAQVATSSSAAATAPATALSPAAAAKAAKKAEEEAAERERARALQAKWDRERAEREAKEEKEKWWKFARMQFGDDGVNAAPAPAPADGGGAGGGAGGEAVPVKVDARSGGRNRHVIDYSWWDAWVPDDAVTLEEAERERLAKERAENDAFEKANPGFVAQFKADLDSREAAEQKKARRAEVLKERGNDKFKKGEHGAALTQYHDALQLTPFNGPVLNNIAACHMALQYWDGVLEFCNRTLFIERYNEPVAVKALFRRAHAYRQTGQLAQAEADLALAFKNDPKNIEVKRELDAVRLELTEAAKESQVRAAASSAAEAGDAGASAAADAAPKGIAHAAAAVLTGLTARATAAAADATATATAEAASGGGSSAGGTLTAVLRSLASTVTSDEDRVHVRACGVLEALCRALVATAHAMLQRVQTSQRSAAATASAAAAAAPPPPAGALLKPVELGPACLVLLAAVDNPKNRLVLRTSGALAAVLDVLSIADAALPVACGHDGDSSEGDTGGGDGEGKDKDKGKKKKKTRYDYAPLLASALSLIDTLARRKDDSHSRLAVCTHPFLRAAGSAGAAPVSYEAVAKLDVPLAAACYHRQQLEALPPAAKVCITQRLAAVTEAMMTNLVLSPANFEVAGHAASVLQALALPAAPLELTAKAKKAAEADVAIPLEQLVRGTMLGLSAVSGSDNVVPVLLQLVTVLLGRCAFDTAVLTSSAMQCAVGALANLAQLEGLRMAFFSPARVSADAEEAARAAAPAALRPLLDLQKVPAQALSAAQLPAWQNIRASALAALANAVVSDAERTKQLVTAGALDVLLLLLGHDATSGQPSQAPDTMPPPLTLQVRARAALLLGRISGDPAAVVAIATPANVRRVLLLLATSLRVTEPPTPPPGFTVVPPASGSDGDDAEAQFQDSMVRMLAVALSSPGAESTLVEPLLTAGALPVLVAYFKQAMPSLKAKAGSGGRSRAVGVGNAAKLMINFSARTDTHATMLACGACDVLVEALMAAGDDNLAVRKNAAVAIARLTRHAGCMERIRELRGVEVLMQIGKQLV